MTDKIISIQALLTGRNKDFDKSTKIKLVRHKDNRKPEERKIFGELYRGTLYHLYQNDNKRFHDYQSEQKKNLFEDVEYIVSFIGEEGLDSRFIGVYKNNGIKPNTLKANGICVFDFEEVTGFEILKERVIIDWHSSAVTWNQWWYNEKYVIRIDKGFEPNIPRFTRYEDVKLNYNELHKIFETQNTEWRQKLEACNCIYLILDKNNGKQYIGSTYNRKGIWGRWSDYAETGHGGDKSLKGLISADADYAKKFFQWSILETLPLNILEDIAIDRESTYKEKLGTRQFGYNNN